MYNPLETFRTDSIVERLREDANSMEDLVAVLTRSRPEMADEPVEEAAANGTKRIEMLLVFNSEPPPHLRDRYHVKSLTQLLANELDLGAYDGTTIAFSALELVLPQLITRGPRHCSMEELFQRLGQCSMLAETQQHLAESLFTILFSRRELTAQPPEKHRAKWLKKAARIFMLSLPAVLGRHEVEGLVAVIPDSDLESYLFEDKFALIYVQPPTTSGLSLRNLESWSPDLQLSTSLYLCAAFDELKALLPTLDPAQHGFVDLRKLIRRVPTPSKGGTPSNRVGRYSDQVRTTVGQLALLHKDQARESTGIKRTEIALAAMTLDAEHWAANQELDGLVAIEFRRRDLDEGLSQEACAYYLTLPEGLADIHHKDLHTLLHIGPPPTRGPDEHRYVVSLRALRRPLRATWRWAPLSDVLFKLDRPDIVATSAFLVSKQMLRAETLRAENLRDVRLLERIVSLAAVACHTYGLANPRRWHRGDYLHELQSSYDN